MDGTNRRILAQDELVLPNGLTFDPFSSQLCWVDAGDAKLDYPGRLLRQELANCDSQAKSNLLPVFV